METCNLFACQCNNYSLHELKGDVNCSANPFVSDKVYTLGGSNMEVHFLSDPTAVLPLLACTIDK